jgi:hypothetical protein
MQAKSLFTKRARMVLRGMGVAGQLSTLLLVVACGGGTSGDTAGGNVVTPPVAVAPTPTPTPAPADPDAPAARNPSVLGVNVTSVDYYSGERSFSNLLVGSEWVDPNNGWRPFDAARINAEGYVSALAPSEAAVIILTPPAASMSGSDVKVRCTFIGTGEVDVLGTITDKTISDHRIDFTWPATPLDKQRVFLQLKNDSASNPVRSLDCRESSVPQSQLFASEFIDAMKPFGVIRFLDWSGANGNASFNWAGRRSPNALVQAGAKGVAIEHMIALVNRTGSSAWFNIPWNSDEAYVRNFAQLAHDRIPAGRPVYVEFSNEVWNYAFPTTHQAQQEGLAQNLSSSPMEAMLRRYAEKMAWAMKIWTEVYADRPSDLVRVSGAQHTNPWTATTILGYGDTAKYVDALATAPYFGHTLFDSGTTDLPTLMQILSTQANEAVAVQAVANQAVAKQYGKRYIAYEAGQHLINTSNPALVVAVNRDQRMYDVYRSYLTSWRTQIGDVMVLYSSSGPITLSGAWGIREFAGQPLAEAPKLRAVIDESASWIK